MQSLDPHRWFSKFRGFEDYPGDVSISFFKIIHLDLFPMNSRIHELEYFYFISFKQREFSSDFSFIFISQ